MHNHDIVLGILGGQPQQPPCKTMILLLGFWVAAHPKICQHSRAVHFLRSGFARPQKVSSLYTSYYYY